MSSLAGEEIRPDLSFGLLADLHYIDFDDQLNFDKTKMRRFRHALDILKGGMKEFTSRETHFNMLLGDLLDGRAKSLGMHHRCLDELQRVLRNEHVEEAPRACAPHFFTLGNHEYYNFTREEMQQRLSPVTSSSGGGNCIEAVTSTSADALYYSFVVHGTFRCVVLDGYDVSIMNSSTPQLQEYAEKLIRDRNPNYAAGSNQWFKDLPFENLRYVPFNGGVGSVQLAWLRDQLVQAAAAGQRVLVFSHQPLLAAASKPKNVVWNCEEVLAVLQDAEVSPRGTVLAVISGHDHDGGHAVDNAGIHHLVPSAPVECDLEQMSYGVINIFLERPSAVSAAAGAPRSAPLCPARMEINWTGKRPSPEQEGGLLWPTSMRVPVDSA